MIGSGENGQLTFLDMVSIMSLMIALQNLDLNLSAEDIQKSAADLEKHVNGRLEEALDNIHGHLSVQDAKLNIIMEKLENMG